MAKGILKFRENYCKGCELCVSVCPKKILKISDTEVNEMGYHPISVVDPDQCTGCAVCALICPDGVISVMIESKLE
jgi:2-oxoglutarate ferredoxin oxidoreductase subunit delta